MTNNKLLPALMVSTALILGACSKKDKGASAGDAIGEVGDLSVKSIDGRAIEKLLDVDKRKVSSADAQTALKKMGLMDESSGLSWAEKSGDNGNYSYKDVKVTAKDGETINIGSLKLTGVHMQDDLATFDRMDATGLVVEGDDSTARIARISMARPSPKLGNGIMKALDTIENLKDLDDLDVDVEFEDGEMAFGAFMMDGLNVTSDEAEVTLASIGWGEDEDSGKAVFLLDNLELTGEDDAKGTPIKMKLGSISGTGIDMNYFRAIGGKNWGKDIIARSKSLGQGAPGFNPYTQTFDSFSMKDLNMSIDTLSITTDGATGKSSYKDGLITVKQSLSPLRVSFTGDPTDRDLIEMREGLQSLGFDELEFSASQTSVLDEKNDLFSVKDAVVDLKDGFNLTYNYEGSGLSAMKNINKDGLSEGDVEAMMENMSLRSMNMSLTDYNLVDRVIKFMAEEQGTSAGLIKMQAKGGLMVLSLGAQTEAQGKALSDLGTALGSFIDDGGTLKVSLNPQTPVSVDQFSQMNPQTMDPELLGFAIEHIK